MEAWIAASLFLTDGRVIRFGADEIEAENVPSDISFDTSNPGGFGSASVTLPRPENLYADDGKLFSHMVLYGPGNQVFYEGFVNGVPQVGNDSIQLNLSGWVSALDKHETFRQIFVDRDLGRWGDASRARRISLLATFNSVLGASTETDTATSLPALTFTTPATEVNPYAEAWYDAGAGSEVESVYYDITSLSLYTYGGEMFTATADDATGAAALLAA